MGLFRSKARPHSDVVVTTAPERLQDDNLVPPQFHNSESSHSNSSSTGSNVSSADTRVNHHQQPQVQPPKTTVITTTTTTTTTTTINGDGSVQTQTHPYDPAADPPPATETTVQSNTTPTQPSTQPGMNQTPVTDTSAQRPQIRRNSTSGGRPIPPRSELRNSMNPPTPLNTNATDAASAPIPVQPGHNEYEPSPLKLNSTGMLWPPTSTQPHPTSPTTAHTDNYNQTPNQAPPPPSQPTTISPAPHSRREGILSAAKGLHGAGEALRGTINSTIAKQMGDDADMIHQRAVKEKGMREVRESGLQARVPVGSGGNRLRKRSLSRGLTTREGQLERVDERADF